MFAYVTVGWCRNIKGLDGPAPKGVLMTDDRGSRAVPQHKLIPSLHKQWQGIVGFADSRNEILLQVCYATKAMQHWPPATWVKAVALLETIDSGVLLFAAMDFNPGVKKLKCCELRDLCHWWNRWSQVNQKLSYSHAKTQRPSVAVSCGPWLEIARDKPPASGMTVDRNGSAGIIWHSPCRAMEARALDIRWYISAMSEALHCPTR